MKKEVLESLRQKFALSTEENYLRIILESYSLYNHRARLDIAKIIYGRLLELLEKDSNTSLQRSLFAELFNKLMQSLEDSALLAIMFMDKSKTPLEHFVNNDTKVFYSFFGKARKGFTDNQILGIYGLKPVKQLLREGLIAPEESSDFQRVFNEMVNLPKAEKERWKKLGRLYTKPHEDFQSKKVEFRKSNVVAVYHNIKHAYKILLPTDLYKKIWVYDENEPPILAVVESYSEFGRGRKLRQELKEFKNVKTIFLGSFPITKESVKEIFERIHPQAQTIKFIADFQLGKLDDPSYPVREIRYSIYKEKVNVEPKHYEPCPCGSGRKFKKCHRLKDYSFIQGLQFSNQDVQ